MKRRASNLISRGGKRGGLSLIELMVTLVLLSIGLVGVSSMFVVGFRTQRHAHFASVGADVASRKIEAMKAAGYNSIDSALFPGTEAVSELPSGQASISFEPYPDSESSNQYLVNVIVVWGGGTGIGGRVALSTVISSHS